MSETVIVTTTVTKTKRVYATTPKSSPAPSPVKSKKAPASSTVKRPAGKGKGLVSTSTPASPKPPSSPSVQSLPMVLARTNPPAVPRPATSSHAHIRSPPSAASSASRVSTWVAETQQSVAQQPASQERAGSVVLAHPVPRPNEIPYPAEGDPIRGYYVVTKGEACGIWYTW